MHGVTLAVVSVVLIAPRSRGYKMQERVGTKSCNDRPTMEES